MIAAACVFDEMALERGHACHEADVSRRRTLAVLLRLLHDESLAATWEAEDAERRMLKAIDDYHAACGRRDVVTSYLARCVAEIESVDPEAAARVAAEVEW